METTTRRESECALESFECLSWDVSVCVRIGHCRVRVLNVLILKKFYSPRRTHAIGSGSCIPHTPQSAMTTGCDGLPLSSPAGAAHFSMSASTSSPPTILPKPACLPVSFDWSPSVKKNCDVFVFLPLLPIASSPRSSSFTFSAAGSSLKPCFLPGNTHSPPLPLFLTKSPPCATKPEMTRWK